MSPIEAFLTSVILVVLAKTLAWLLQVRSGNAGVVDAIWAFSLGGLAVFYALVGSAPAETRLVLAVLGGLWGLRLGSHLWSRTWGHVEDWRYAQFRAQWGAQVNLKMFGFFQFQNLFTLALSASAFLTVAYRPDDAPNWAQVLAVLIWVTAVLGETLADNQMEEFRRHPHNKGQVCDQGLWYYSRHPNYFFECLHWLAYVPLALGSPWGWLSCAAPLVMAGLLMKLSGIPMLEEGLLRRKPGYADYVARTSALIPWPPKRRS
ncbi:DUF1295 domain-containing protein [Stagnimonas aquatica]|uniref:DUF1295 domain-containing protein n=1 Tax=Stagnimonas aquatica TaxID=2689987 RepID=A0A3N0V7C1_9GAMM|nr:DUF1295 domain-containing protein [Stagnimonas aquatica]ROH88690.1 DUF1295 domain-containing protein [Stagnimonas aquatica]